MFLFFFENRNEIHQPLKIANQRARKNRRAKKIDFLNRLRYKSKPIDGSIKTRVFFPSRSREVILQDLARFLQKRVILQDLARWRLSCKILQDGGYLARILKEGGYLARILQESCKITIPKFLSKNTKK